MYIYGGGGRERGMEGGIVGEGRKRKNFKNIRKKEKEGKFMIIILFLWEIFKEIFYLDVEES